MLVGINFALEFALLDVVVLTDFLLFLKAAEELLEDLDAAEFAPALEFLLACCRLPFFYHLRPKDPKNFWNGLAESLVANLLLI